MRESHARCVILGRSVTVCSVPVAVRTAHDRRGNRHPTRLPRAARRRAAQPPAAAASTVPGGDTGWPHVGGSPTIEGVDEIGEKYGKLAGILSLTPVHVLLLCLATMQAINSLDLEFRSDKRSV